MNQENTNTQVAILNQTGKDLAVSIFIVSVLLNFAIFIAWLLVATDTKYALALVAR